MCETSLLSQAVLKHVVSKDFIFKKSVQGTGSASCQIYGIAPYQKFFMSCYITFKKKTSTCGSQVGHMWVTSGLFCGSVGHGSTGMTHFQPCSGSISGIV